jgi:mRNA degradation ribonuclease J1/J2
MDDPTAVLAKVADAVREAIGSHASGRSDISELQKTIRQATGRVIRAETSRRPVIVPVVMEL